MAILVTLDEVKLSLRIRDNDSDELIEMLIPRASGTILDYLKLPSTSWQTTTGEPDDVPDAVVSAVIVDIAARLENPEQHIDGPQILSQAVKDLLHRLRDPALA